MKRFDEVAKILKVSTTNFPKSQIKQLAAESGSLWTRVIRTNETAA